MTTASLVITRLRLSAALSALALLSACSGGGGGGGAVDPGIPPPPPPPPPTGGTNPTLESLLPLASTAGATLYADAATLRPVSAGSVYSYRGVFTPNTGGTAVRYLTATTQAAGSETASNAANAGARTAPVANPSGGTVTNTQSIDYAGKGTKEAVTFKELQSPVRVDDQTTVLLKRYAAADTTVDVDKDGKTDLLDVAIYSKVIGKEALVLPNLPTVNAVRVDTVTLRRATRSSDSLAGPIDTSTVSTWYAQGIGIVRQTTTLPATTGTGSQTTDEKIVFWDGQTNGFGAMAPVAGVVPAGGTVPAGAVPGTSNGLRAAVGFDDYALVFTTSGADTVVSRLDNRGRVQSARLLTGVSLTATTRLHRAGAGVVMTRPLGAKQVAITRLDGSGALVGAIDAVKITLTGDTVDTTRIETGVDTTNAVWILWPRVVGTGSDLVLASFLLDTGAPQLPEIPVVQKVTTNSRLAVAGTVALASWQSGSPSEVGWATGSFAPGGSTPPGTFISNLRDVTVPVTPLRFGATGAMIWPVTSTAPGTAGLLLDPNNKVIIAPGAVSFNTELLVGAPPFAAASPAATTLGTRAVFSSLGSGDLWPGETNAAIVPGTVSWVDVLNATDPLTKQLATTVRYSFEGATQQAQLADRVLMFGGATALSTTVVWLNRGPAN
jgi:hypothetical protein